MLETQWVISEIQKTGQREIATSAKKGTDFYNSNEEEIKIQTKKSDDFEGRRKGSLDHQISACLSNQLLVSLCHFDTASIRFQQQLFDEAKKKEKKRRVNTTKNVDFVFCSLGYPND